MTVTEESAYYPLELRVKQVHIETVLLLEELDELLHLRFDEDKKEILL